MSKENQTQVTQTTEDILASIYGTSATTVMGTNHRGIIASARSIASTTADIYIEGGSAIAEGCRYVKEALAKERKLAQMEGALEVIETQIKFEKALAELNAIKSK